MAHFSFLQVEQLDLVEVKDPSEVLMAVHGTTMAAWNSISEHDVPTLDHH